MARTDVTYVLAPGIRAGWSGDALEFRRGLIQSTGIRVRDDALGEALLQRLLDRLGGQGLSYDELISLAADRPREEVPLQGLFRYLVDREVIMPRDRVEAASVSGLAGLPLSAEGPPKDSASVVLFSDIPGVEECAYRVLKPHEMVLRPPEALGGGLQSASEHPVREEATDEPPWKPGSSVVAYLSAIPDLDHLTRLNRIALRHRTLWTMTVIDGLTLWAASFSPLETECFECILTRFGRSALSPGASGTRFRGRSAGAALELLACSLGLLEAHEIYRTGRGLLMGRVLEIRFPELSLRIQDALRLGSCSACGYSGLGQPTETYFDIETLIGKIWEQLGVSEGEKDGERRSS